MSNLPESYLVKPIMLESVAATLDPGIWMEAFVLDDFRYPWNEGTPPKTVFRALHSSETFHFQFEVEDDDLCAKVFNNDQMEVAESDRVELFFCKDERLDPYYCLEMDYLGRLLSNSAQYHRKMNYDWNWPGGFQFQSEKTGTGFSVQGSISKASLVDLGLLNDQQLRVGIFRGQYSHQEGQAVRWISWIHPGTPRPDFHVPSAFGLLKLL